MFNVYDNNMEFIELNIIVLYISTIFERKY